MAWARRDSGIVDDLIERGRITEALALLRKPKFAVHEGARKELAAKLASVERLFAHMDGGSWGKPKGMPETMLLWHRCTGRVHHFKAHITLDVPPIDLLVILREWDLVPEWNSKNVPAAYITDEPRLTAMRAAAELYFPPPFTNRSAAFDAEGFDLLDSHGSIAVEFATTEGAMAAMPKELQPLQHVSFDSPSGMRILPQTSQRAAQPGKPVVSDRCVVTWTVAFDPITFSVPSWLVEFIIAVVAPFVYAQLVKVVTSIRGEYAARRAQRDHLYGPLTARCDEHVAMRLAAAAGPRRANSRGKVLGAHSQENLNRRGLFSKFGSMFKSASAPVIV